MAKTEYLVLMRGLNSGGNNVIKMNELKNLFEKLNFADVRTYIQSGNVIFADCEKDTIKLRNKIEKTLLNKLNKEIKVLILKFSDIADIINGKPEGFGDDNKNRYDIIYLMEPLKVKTAIKEITPREGVDKIYSGEKVLYMSSLKDATKDYLSNVLIKSISGNITIRNWNTTKKLYELMTKNNRVRHHSA
jgi:uncharacterized protein (DUF1697 family)